MKPRLLPVLLAAAWTVAAAPAAAQTVVVDQGTFTLTVAGRSAGTETFAIRRSGLGNEGTILAHGVVTLTLDGNESEVRPVLVAIPTDGSTTEYEVKVSGADEMEGRLVLAGNRYVSRFRSAAGEEEREFLARPGTRVLDVMVAHQYYFLRGVREGTVASIVEPRTRRAIDLVASAWENEVIQLGPNRVPARRVTFGVGADARTVWYDSQGRVLRVAIPALNYVAQRQDVVG